jgi:hypothetical protein
VRDARHKVRKRYARSGPVEFFRQFVRIVDFLVLLVVQSRQGRLPSVSALRGTSFVELGPGPTRFAFLKRSVFRDVYFVDQSSFDIPDPGLRICDLENCESVTAIVSDVCSIPIPDRVLIFADHCLEHLSEEHVMRLLKSIAATDVSACFRVPNIMSPQGKRNFANDGTHRTPFNNELRRQIQGIGINIVPWIRWYRLRAGGKDKMRVAEEVVLCYSAKSI